MRNRRIILKSLALAALILATVPTWAGTSASTDGGAWNMEAIGHNNLDGRGFNADVWVHRGFVFVNVGDCW